MKQSVPKRLHIKFRHREISQKKAYNKVDYALFIMDQNDWKSELDKNF
jgi:hypothetical protein